MKGKTEEKPFKWLYSIQIRINTDLATIEPGTDRKIFSCLGFQLTRKPGEAVLSICPVDSEPYLVKWGKIKNEEVKKAFTFAFNVAFDGYEDAVNGINAFGEYAGVCKNASNPKDRIFAYTASVAMLCEDVHRLVCNRDIITSDKKFRITPDMFYLLNVGYAYDIPSLNLEQDAEGYIKH